MGLLDGVALTCRSPSQIAVRDHRRTCRGHRARDRDSPASTSRGDAAVFRPSGLGAARLTEADARAIGFDIIFAYWPIVSRFERAVRSRFLAALAGARGRVVLARSAGRSAAPSGLPQSLIRRRTPARTARCTAMLS